MQLSQEVEDFYRQVHAADSSPAPQFPRSYPHGSLIGCIEIVDVLTVSPMPSHPPCIITEVPAGCAMPGEACSKGYRMSRSAVLWAVHSRTG